MNGKAFLGTLKFPTTSFHPHVGETKNKGETIELAHECNINVLNSFHRALCDHGIKMKHTPKWNEVEIVLKDREHKLRQIKERLRITPARRPTPHFYQ